MIRRTLLSIVIVALSLQVLHAQETQFFCSVDRTEVPVGQQFQVTYTLSGGSLRQYSNFRAPDLNRNFMTLAGPSSSQQMQIINGRVSASISWIYVLQPRNTGTFTVPAATITYDGKSMTSNTVSIKVTRAVPNAGGANQQKQQDNTPDVDLGDNLFIRAIPNRTSVYLGEPLTVTYKLYSRVAFQLDNPIKLPRMVGFWSEDIEAPTQLQPRVEVYNGRQYETYMLRKVLYFPTQSGKLTIEPFEIGTTVRVRKQRKTGNDAFDRFFSDPLFDSYDHVKKNLLTQKVNVTVRPLPEDGQPKGFSGVVGSYEMRATLDRNAMKANETATLKVVLTGKGNIRLLDEPVITFPSGVDHYDPTIDEDAKPLDGTLSGSKTFEYLLVPRYAGKVTIPPVVFSFFDLDLKKYVTLESQAFTLDIAEGDVRKNAGDLTQKYVDYLSMDVRGIREGTPRFDKNVSHGIRPLIMLLCYLIPVVLLFAALMWKQRFDRLHTDVAGMKRRKATRVAERRLSESKKHLEAGNIDAYYLEIARALWGYVQDKLDIPTSETAIDTVIVRLRNRNVDELVADRMRNALEAVEYARFSPSRASTDEMRALYDQAKEAIIQTEQAMRSVV
ncbi:MAG: protein BatD [Bacteroidetes bacterium]|nr:protein BatD [Bacteroidota bacterium]